MEREILKLGTFECQSGELVVSDPCYSLDDLLYVNIRNAKKGKWHAEVVKRNVIMWGTRNMTLYAYHESVKSLDELHWLLLPVRIDVDSGQAGIFDKQTFRNDEIITTEPNYIYVKDVEGSRWYAACCDITLSGEKAGVLPGGCVSQSGLGDGTYNCCVAEKDGEVVGVVIGFGEK